MFYIREHQILIQTNPNGYPVPIIAMISNEPTLSITTMPDGLCFIYSMNCQSKRRKKKKTKGKRKRKMKGRRKIKTKGRRKRIMKRKKERKKRKQRKKEKGCDLMEQKTFLC